MISFIIPAYNEERLLGNTLRAIHTAAQATGMSCECGSDLSVATEIAALRPLPLSYEIVVADDNSTDQTATVAEQNGARVVKVAHRQIAATRNSGARAAKGEIFIFVDADTIVSEAVVRDALDAMNRGVAGGGAAARFDDPVPTYARIMLPIMVRLFRLLRLAAGCFIYCSRRAFEASGGFDEKMFGGEEIAMSQALKRQGKFVVLRSAVTTSGRKLRAYSLWEISRVMFRLGLKGHKAVSNRKGMELWYERRDDTTTPP